MSDALTDFRALMRHERYRATIRQMHPEPTVYPDGQILVTVQDGGWTDYYLACPQHGASWSYVAPPPPATRCVACEALELTAQRLERLEAVIARHGYEVPA